MRRSPSGDFLDLAGGSTSLASGLGAGFPILNPGVGLFADIIGPAFPFIDGDLTGFVRSTEGQLQYVDESPNGPVRVNLNGAIVPTKIGGGAVFGQVRFAINGFGRPALGQVLAFAGLPLGGMTVNDSVILNPGDTVHLQIANITTAESFVLVAVSFGITGSQQG